MTKVKEIFGITEQKYQFEWNDLRCLITIANVALIMIFGLKVAWFGLATNVVGLIKEVTGKNHINGLVMYCANIVLNIYFITLL